MQGLGLALVYPCSNRVLLTSISWAAFAITRLCLSKELFGKHSREIDTLFYKTAKIMTSFHNTKVNRNLVSVVFRFLRTLLAHEFRDVPHLHCVWSQDKPVPTTTSSIFLFHFTGWLALAVTPVWLLLTLDENLRISCLCNLFIKRRNANVNLRNQTNDFN